MGNPVGRPTKYNDAMQEQADSYLYSLEELGHAIPSRAGLCCFLGISKSTSQLWEQEYAEFSATLSNIEVLQEHMALNGGITNKMNSTIVKLVLANHGYSDRSAIDHTTKGEAIDRGRSLDDFYQQGEPKEEE